MDPSTPTSLPGVILSAAALDKDKPLELGSWFTLYESDGSTQSTRDFFEAKPKRGKDIKNGDIILYQGSACVVGETPIQHADGKISIHVYDVIGDIEHTFDIKDVEEMTIVVTSLDRYSLV